MPTLEQLNELRASIGEALTYVEVHIALASAPIVGMPAFNPDADVLAELDTLRAKMQTTH